MKWKLTFLLFLALFTRAFNQTDTTVFVHPLIKEKIGVREVISCMLVMKNQEVDVTIPRHLPKEEKTTLLYQSLDSLAEITQQPLLDSLIAWGIPHQSYHIVNVIQAMVDSTTLSRIASRSDLRSVLPDFPLMSPPEMIRPGDIRRMDTLLHWGISHIRADSVWRLGYTGQGVVVAGLDTGVEGDHKFLRQNYRGLQPNGHINHRYSWHDGIRHINALHQDSVITPTTNPCGLFSQVPCDDQGHGTLTMGLMVGQYEGQHTGIAPGARWIGSRVMERGYGLLSTYLSGLEWCLAPGNKDSHDVRPELAPDIINNSWACPRKEGCIPENYWILDSAAARLSQAGIFVVASAGNDGRLGCGSLRNPLAIFSSVFTVGATNRRDSIAAFSSRGPVDGAEHSKPEVVAPGQGITSIYPNGQFRKSSGTSISAPLVAGVAALILEANPKLRGRPDLLREILIQSAVPISENPCSIAMIPNPVYGYGRIDALNAVLLAQQYHPTPTSENIPDQKLLIFPNPVKNVLHLSNQNIQSAQVTVYSIEGKVMTRCTIGGWENRDIVVSGYHPGLYIVRFISDSGVSVQKLMKI